MLRYLLLLLCLCLVHAKVSQNEADAFLQWLKDRSQFKVPIKFTLAPTTSHDSGFLGQVKPIASKDIKEGEVVFSFTPQESFNYENSKEDLFSDLVDILHLIHEVHLKDSSSWAPYLKILPTKFTTPIFWTPTEFAELRGTSLFGQTLKLNKTISMEYKAIIESRNYTSLFPDSAKLVTNSDSEDVDDVEEDDIITSVEWWWAYSTFRSRNWKTEKGTKLTPVLELFNYAHDSNVQVVPKDRTVDLVAETDIPKGQTLIINDGLIANRELLDWYGFVSDANDKDYFPVGIGLDPDEKLYGAKRDLFKRRGIKDGQTFALKKNLIPRDLVFALRVYHLTVYDYSEAENAMDNKIVSVQNEASVCSTIIDLCENTLDALKHPLTKDKEKLNSPDTVGNLRSAITLRRAEKKILHSVLKLAKMQEEDVQKHWSSRSFEIPTVRDPNKG